MIDTQLPQISVGSEAGRIVYFHGIPGAQLQKYCIHSCDIFDDRIQMLSIDPSKRGTVLSNPILAHGYLTDILDAEFAYPVPHQHWEEYGGVHAECVYVYLLWLSTGGPFVHNVLAKVDGNWDVVLHDDSTLIPGEHMTLFSEYAVEIEDPCIDRIDHATNNHDAYQHSRKRYRASTGERMCGSVIVTHEAALGQALKRVHAQFGKRISHVYVVGIPVETVSSKEQIVHEIYEPQKQHQCGLHVINNLRPLRDAPRSMEDVERVVRQQEARNQRDMDEASRLQINDARGGRSHYATGNICINTLWEMCAQLLGSHPCQVNLANLFNDQLYERLDAVQENGVIISTGGHYYVARRMRVDGNVSWVVLDSISS